MLVEIKDLKEGDEILVPSQVDFKHLKLLRTPVLRPDKPNSWRTGYKNVQCSIYNSNLNGQYSVYKCTGDAKDHNDKISFDLNYRSIWLIRREKEEELC